MKSFLTSKYSRSRHMTAVILILLIIVSGAGAFTILLLKANSTSYDIATLRKLPISSVEERLNGSQSLPYESIYDEGLLPDRKDYSIDYLTQQSELPLTLPIDWNYKVKTNRSLNFNLHSWDMLNAFLYAHKQTGDKEYLEVALKVALDWVNNNKLSLKNNQESNFAWYDMAVGVRSYRLSYILDQSIRLGLGSEYEREQLWQSLIDHLQYLQDDDNIIFHNNHGLYQAAGEAAVARRFQPVSGEFKAIRNQASERLQSMISQQFTSEGVHKEHSPDYHRMIYGTLLNLKKEGLIDDAYSSEIISKAGNVLYWMIKPDDVLVNFGDTDYRKIARDPEVYTDKEAEYLNYYASDGAEGKPPISPLKGYLESGLAVVKTSSSYLAQQAAFHSRTHKHADDLTFSWYDKDQDILIDAGKYGYLGDTDQDSEDAQNGFWYADEKRQFVEKTRAHNTVEIDGKDYIRKGAEPYGSALVSYGEAGNGAYYIESKAEQFETIGHERLLVFKPGEWLVVIDNLKDSAQKDHEYTQWFHLAENLKVMPTEYGFISHVGDSNLHILNLVGGVKKTAPIIGQTKPYLQGWFSSLPGEFKPNTAIAFKAEGKDTVLPTLFAFGDNVSSDVNINTIESSKGSFGWLNDGVKNQLLFNRQDGKLTVEYRD